MGIAANIESISMILGSILITFVIWMIFTGMLSLFKNKEDEKDNEFKS